MIGFSGLVLVAHTVADDLGCGHERGSDDVVESGLSSRRTQRAPGDPWAVRFVILCSVLLGRGRRGEVTYESWYNIHLRLPRDGDRVAHQMGAGIGSLPTLIAEAVTGFAMYALKIRSDPRSSSPRRRPIQLFPPWLRGAEHSSGGPWHVSSLPLPGVIGSSWPRRRPVLPVAVIAATAGAGGAGGGAHSIPLCRRHPTAGACGSP